MIEVFSCFSDGDGDEGCQNSVGRSRWRWCFGDCDDAVVPLEFWVRRQYESDGKGTLISIFNVFVPF